MDLFYKWVKMGNNRIERGSNGSGRKIIKIQKCMPESGKRPIVQLRYRKRYVCNNISSTQLSMCENFN